MFFQTILTALLAVGAQAGGVADLVAEGALTGRSSRVLESRMAFPVAKRVVLSSRQSASTLTSTNSTANTTAWDAQVSAACQTALSKLTVASNPSGTCACYNLPALDTQTGAFEADLRLYQISPATGDFAGIPANQVQVSMSYNGASVSPVSASTAQAMLTTRQDLQLLQAYTFVGQIDQSKMAAGELSTVEAQTYVIPTLTLSAQNAAGSTVSTNVSVNEAAFVAGAFSTLVELSTTAQAQIAVDEVVAGLANGTVAFVLPGVNLLIFPVGLIVSGVWFVIGIAVIGFGFFERVQYRETYRRRAAMATKGAELRRI